MLKDTVAGSSKRTTIKVGNKQTDNNQKKKKTLKGRDITVTQKQPSSKIANTNLIVLLLQRLIPQLCLAL